MKDSVKNISNQELVNKLKKFFGYVVGLFLFPLMLVSLFTSCYWAALCCTLMIFISVPLFRNVIERVTKLSVRKTVYIFSALLVLFMFSLITEVNKKREGEYLQNKAALIENMRKDIAAEDYSKAVASAEKYISVADEELRIIYNDAKSKASAKQEHEDRQNLKTEFKANRSSIIKNLKSLIAQKKYQEAQEISDKYSVVNDKDLNNFGKQAARGLASENAKIPKQQAVISQSQNAHSNVSSFAKNINEGTMKAISMTLCESAVKSSLKAPSTADFPWSGKLTTYPTSQSVVYTSYVDAQNGFGAMLRTNYACTLKYKGGDMGDVENWDVANIATF